MPHNPIDYANTVIYKIVSNDLTITDSYVGHKTDFKSRKCQHKNTCNNEKVGRHNLKVYKFIRENGGWNSFSMVLIENYPCKDTHEAASRERCWYETLNAQLNAIYPQRSRTEYLENNKDIISQQRKRYREIYNQTHKESISKHSGEIPTCECGSSFRLGYLARHNRTKSHMSYTTNHSSPSLY
jgi:hypothetical protein